MPDHEHTDAIICPHCGHEQGDAWEVDFGPCLEGDTEMWCGDCGRGFSASRHVLVSYSTRALKPEKGRTA